MRVLSDCPDRLPDLADGAGWSEARVDSLPAGERALWRALSPGERLWCGTARDPGPPGFWSGAAIVAEAPSSQFDVLRERLARDLDLPGPTACLALSGRGFHGQRDRPWLSAPGNLHLCVAFPEPGLAAREARALPMLPAVALVDAVPAMTGGALQPGIKWVNDVLLDGRKIGGVLTATQTQKDRVAALLLGIGLNVAKAPPVPPTPFVPSVGCLADAGTRVALTAALLCVLAALGRRMRDVVVHGPGALLEAYRDASLVIGRDVCVFEDPASAESGSRPSPILRGTVRDITADLSLILEGVAAPVSSGRLAFAEDCRRLGPGSDGPTTEPTPAPRPSETPDR